jgi:ribosome-binding factor A
MNKSYPRSSRIADLIREEAAMLLLHGVSDPRVSGVSITDVIVSEDLENAKIYFVTRNSEDKKKAEQGLISAKGFIKKHLSKAISIRRLPEIYFIYDEVFENGIKFEQVLNKIKKVEGKI